MRVLCLTENAPVEDVTGGDGSTMISANLLSRLPPDVEIDLVHFLDTQEAATVEFSARLRERLVDVAAVPLRGARRALPAQFVSPLPRATWRRSPSAELLRLRSARADVTYVHGLHALAGLDSLSGPVVVHLVDPWSEYWRQRAQTRRGAARWYDLSQARRADALERRVADRADAVILVNPDDAARCARRWRRPVVALPNGVSVAHATATSLGGHVSRTVAFVGSLDYPPNLEALRVAVHEVLPLVWRVRPEVEFVVAGRRAGQEAVDLASRPAVRLLGAVPEVSSVFRGAAAALYVGRSGRGTKNTVGEALAAGCPVVASPEAARGWPSGAGLLVAGTAQEQAAAVVAAVDGEVPRPALATRTWDEAALEFAEVLVAAARGRVQRAEEFPA